MLDRIVDWIESRKIFLRKRKSNEIRALGMLLYRAGLSYEKVGNILNALGVTKNGVNIYLKMEGLPHNIRWFDENVMGRFTQTGVK